jgi:UDP-glucose 6-dehydrogenase
MKVGVVGAAIGLAGALVLCELRHDVTLFDVDPSRHAGCAGRAAFFGPDAAASLRAATGCRWTVTDRGRRAGGMRRVLIAVPTPRD